ncbi:hypothetical protein NE293_03960 [Latilactobacillus curvatus]|uniref:hypothetical protein n=1 Tax=Latilactobacillus curvatus TaxID=28038 RepID=UPI0020733F94|nr:hypothetical protein [Latilactobacillus curvatus]MCM6843833.1 hypothetical protein [Latilactobacillus curvatus]MCM6861280.1 hypothetical protein [Latilactobacillus curvatus]MCM6868578.1 hypothetical protein [Latilactobacillus curvatus]
MNDNFSNQNERDRLTPTDYEPKLIGYDYAGREVFESDSRIIFDGYIICEGDEHDFLLTMGGDAVD